MNRWHRAACSAFVSQMRSLVVEQRLARVVALLHRDVREPDQQCKLVGACEATLRQKPLDIREKVELEVSSRR